MALEAAALAVSIVALVVSIGAIVWQARQGQRIGMSVISTVDQIYRALTHLDETQYDADVWPTVSKKYIKRGGELDLRLRAMSSDLPFKVKCQVEPPSRKPVSFVGDHRPRNGMIDFRVTYPRDFQAASTSEPGRYHVWWYVREDWEGAPPGFQPHGQDSFGVLP